jgi:hypothetical protein
MVEVMMVVGWILCARVRFSSCIYLLLDAMFRRLDKHEPMNQESHILKID